MLTFIARRLSSAAILLVFCATSIGVCNSPAYAASYFLDSVTGNDSNPGTSEAQAWKTLSKINSTALAPGDTVRFKRGSSWTGTFNPSGSGTTANPIVVDAYGSGSLPIINGNGAIRIIDLKNRNNITLRNLQLENATILIHIRGTSSKILIENCVFYRYAPSAYAAVTFDDYQSVTPVPQTRDCEVRNCTFGKRSGDDVANQQYAGIAAITLKGRDHKIHHNTISHNSVENESANGFYTTAIEITAVSGLTEIYDNDIYHTGGHAIIAHEAYYDSGDEIRIYNNKVAFPGQGGIVAWKTRHSSVASTAKGKIYNNEVSYCNRLGGAVGGNGQQACGIHINDSFEYAEGYTHVEPDKPFLKWFIYDNVVHDCQASSAPNSEDSGGIAVDYNASGAEIYHNLIYNNWGKGLYIFNADNTKVWGNIIFGNDVGIGVGAVTNDPRETAHNNEIYNNILYKNFNGAAHGTNSDCEIAFGSGSANLNTTIRNNILYAHENGTVYRYLSSQSTGNILDHNLVFSANPDLNKFAVLGWVGSSNFKSWQSWKNIGFDAEGSLYAQPRFEDTDTFKFNPLPDSPSIDAGVDLGLEKDFVKTDIPQGGAPDIGAYEFVPASPPANNPPTAYSQTISTSEDTAREILLTAADPDEDTLAYSVVRLPNHGQLSGTPPNLVYVPSPNYSGSDSFTFWVDDGKELSNTATISIGVNAVNDAPTLSLIGNKSVDEGTALAFTVAATDVDADDSLTYSASPLPSGASFDASSGVFSWVPSATQSGTYQVSFSVSDGKGGSDSEVVSISVIDVNRPPVGKISGLSSVTAGASTRYKSTSTDPDGSADIVSYSWKVSKGVKILSGKSSKSMKCRFPAYNATASNKYKVVLTVKDKAGLSSTVRKTVTVKKP